MRKVAGITVPLLCVFLFAAAAPVSEVRLVRTECYGGCPVDVLVLRTDGTAQYSGMRHSTISGDFDGYVWKHDVERLVQWMRARGFESLPARVAEQNIDAATHVLSLTHGGKTKSVVSSDLAPPDDVWAITRMISGIGASVRWTPVASGIHGSWRGPVMISMKGAVSSYAPLQDDQGRFRVPLRAGTYTLSDLPMALPRKSTPVTVVVKKGEWTAVGTPR